jgi:hypothetical protein
MIVTKELLLAVGGCNIIVDQLITEGYTGLTRLEFVNKLQEDADLDLHPQWWVGWAKTYLYNGDTIFNNAEFIKTNRYDIEGMNIDPEYRLFDNLQEAETELKLKRDEYIASENWMFHINAICVEGENTHTLHTCDLDGDGVFDHDVTCYTCFNHLIGEYERFDTFEQAKIRCEELKADRIATIDASYFMKEELQQINDPEENPAGWIFLKKFTDIIY